MSGEMLRSHHLCRMAIHIEKTCDVRSFGDPGRCVLGLPYSTDDEISTSNHSFL